MSSPADHPPAGSAPQHRSPREARLLPEHAAIYAGVPAGEWVAAATLARQILVGLVGQQGQPPAINARLMNDQHLEFRGGERAPRAIRHSRAHDTPADAG